MNHLPAPKKQTQTNPIQTQSKPVLSAVEWANFFTGQLRFPKNLATPLFSHDLIIACHKWGLGYIIKVPAAHLKKDL